MKILVVASIISVAAAQFGGFSPFNAAQGVAGKVAQGAKDAGGKFANLVQGNLDTFGQNFGQLAKTPAELAQRKEIFSKNQGVVDNFNKLYEAGKTTFKQGLSPLSGLTNLEFNKFFNGFKGSKYPPSPETTYKPPPAAQGPPERVDWREKGAVTPVKSQYLCAGCWAFAAAGALEGHVAKKTGQLHVLSPQNLIDCCGELGNDGCDGGTVDVALTYTKANGINEFSSYPYENITADCRFKGDNVAAKNRGYQQIPQGNEKALAGALAAVGPIAIGINAGLESFQLYKEGIYYDEKCSNNPADANHAVLLVGYGKEANGEKYWIIKNTYGPEWGEEGYFRLAKDKGNHCGVANFAYFPVV